jgi:Ca2+-binding EF-hand superfamily protein
MRILKALAVTIFLGGCAAAAATAGFPAADADDDDVLSAAEFQEAFDDLDAYERYDDDDDGNLSRTEYNEAVDEKYETDAYFKGLDRDANSQLSRQEFIDGWFAMFDADQSKTLSEGEFRSAVDALSVEL